ncbi:MAG: ATP-binding protein [Hyphomicrobiales bacterium]
MSDNENTSTRSLLIGRLLEARWLLIALAVVFLFFSSRWPDSERMLILAYVLLCGVIVFSWRKTKEAKALGITAEKKQRSIWPATQVKMFVNAIPEPCVVLDGEGMVRYTNTPMRDAFGTITKGELLTQKFRNPDVASALSDVKANGLSVSIPYRERFPTERHYLIHMSPIVLSSYHEAAPGPDFICVVMLEQTERYRLEEFRSEFIANVSHELRTPIASLTGFIETLLGPAKDDEVNRERFLKIMLEQSQRMGRLVGDLLSLSRIEMRSHLRPTNEVNLAAIVNHVTDAMVPLAKEAQLKVNIKMNDGLFMVRGDQDELVQAVGNLLENAIKYGGDGKSVDVSVLEVPAPVEFDKKGRECYMIDVQDCGKGIDSVHIPRLTERFYRVDAEESKAKMGTGLGLAVVKHILARHQAYLRIVSTKGEGTSFKIYFLKLEHTSDNQNI